MRSLLLALLIAGLAAPAAAGARPGDLDRTFGSGGFVELSFGSGETSGVAVAIARDRSIAAAGFMRSATGEDRLAVALLRSDGRRRATPTIGFAPGARYGQALGTGIQRSGGIVVGGDFGDGLGGRYIGLTRLTSRGRLDVTFGDGGRVLLPIPGALALDVELDAQDRILVSGRLGTGGMFIRRFRADGLPDLGFGADGMVARPDLPPAETLTTDSRSRVVVGSVDPVARALTVVRFTARGTLDTRFGAAGIARGPRVGVRPENVGGLVALPDGYAVVGRAWRRGRSRFLIARFTRSGRRARFGSRGFAEIGGRILQPGSIVRQRDGKLVVVGSTGIATAVARLHPSGRPDRSFSRDGFLIRSYGRDDGTASRAAAIQGRRLVVVGTDSLDERIDYSSRMVIARWRL